MSIVEIKLDIDGAKDMKAALEEIDMKAKNPRGLYQSYGGYMKTIPLRAMREQSDPVTLQPWPQRNPISLQSRRGSGGKMLQDSTALLRSLNQAPIKIDSSGVSVGTDLKYALTHQLGKTIKPKKKFLTIPLEPSARRLKIRDWFTKMKASKPFFYHSKSGKVLAAYSSGKGKNSKLKFAWLLVRQVVVPQRRFAGFGKRDKERFVEDARTFFAVKKKGD